MKRVLGFFVAAALSSGAVAAVDPRTVPTQLPPAWQAKTRAVFKQAIEIPSVHHRGEVPRVAKLLADQFRAAGIPDADIHFMPYEALPGDKTVALIVRWRSPHATKKPMMILGHMDVVEAKREDWKYDPFVFREDGGCGAYSHDYKPMGCGVSMAEKTFQTYFFTTHNEGGHSSRPRPDNAIYDLADALKRLQGHRFEPMLNQVSRAYFTERAKEEKGPLGDAIRRWLANPNDGEAADIVEADPLEVGHTR